MARCCWGSMLSWILLIQFVAVFDWCCLVCVILLPSLLSPSLPPLSFPPSSLLHSPSLSLFLDIKWEYQNAKYTWWPFLTSSLQTQWVLLPPSYSLPPPSLPLSLPSSHLLPLSPSSVPPTLSPTPLPSVSVYALPHCGRGSINFMYYRRLNLPNTKTTIEEGMLWSDSSAVWETNWIMSRCVHICNNRHLIVSYGRRMNYDLGTLVLSSRHHLKCYDIIRKITQRFVHCVCVCE